MTPYQLTAEEIITRVAEHVGGDIGVRNVRSFKISGRFVMEELNGLFEVYQERESWRHYVNADIGSFSYKTGYDGKRLWRVDGNERATLAPPNDVERYLIETRYGLFDYLVNPGEYNFYLNSEVDKEYRVTITPRSAPINDDFRLEVAVDPESWLIVRERYGSKVTSYEDYRSLGTYRFPHLLRIIDGAGNESLNYYDAVELNSEFDENLFELPDGGQQSMAFDDASGKSDIPIDLQSHIFADVALMGRQCQCMIDTGHSGMTAISERLAAELSLKRIGSIRKIGVGGPVDLALHTIPEMRIGGVQLFDCHIMSTDFSEVNRYLPSLDCILGTDFLARFVVRIDYAEGKLSLLERDTFEYNGEGEILPLQENIFPGTLDGVSGTFTMDSGADTFTLLTPFARQHGYLANSSQLPSDHRIGGLGSTPHTSYYGVCRSLRIGRFELTDLPTTVADASEGAFANEGTIGNVGNIIWRKFIVYLDLWRERLILERGREFDDPYVMNRTGIGLVKQDEGIYFNDPVLGSPGAEAGVKAGDQLIAIDGSPVTVDMMSAIRRRFVEAPGTTCRFAVRTTDGEERHVEITLQDYYPQLTPAQVQT